jgi:hypothetical protein
LEDIEHYFNRAAISEPVYSLDHVLLFLSEYIKEYIILFYSNLFAFEERLDSHYKVIPLFSF